MKIQPSTTKRNRKSTRLKQFDYSSNGYYFITICTKNRINHFGEIQNSKMILNPLGKIAKEYWNKIKELHHFVRLLSFVMMPNHIHGIIIISHPERHDDASVGACHRHAPTGHAPTGQTIHDIQLPPKGIPSLINHYKGAVKKWANKNQNKSFTWQRNYHDHIIRDENELNRIQEYILTNSMNWKNDENNLSLK